MDIGVAFPEVCHEPLQAFPLLGIHVDELHTEVLPGCPRHAGSGNLDRLLVRRNVYTERDGCSNLYIDAAFNGAATR